MRKTLAILAATLLLPSCAKDAAVPVSDVTTAGFVREAALVDDTGQIFNICEDSSDAGLNDGDRVIATFDILRKNTDGSYDISITDAVKPLCKAAVEESDIEGDDPISIDNGWISGTYLNLRMHLILKNSSSTVHRLELVRYSPGETDTLRLRLRHDAYGDVFDGSQNPSGFVAGTTWASFDLKELIPSGKKEIPVTIRSRRYSERLGSIDYTSTELYSIKGKISL